MDELVSDSGDETHGLDGFFGNHVFNAGQLFMQSSSFCSFASQDAFNA